MKTLHRFPLAAILLAALLAVPAYSVHAASEKEQALLEILRSQAPAAEKAIACKKLAIFGSAESVPELAKLLPNPQLSSWARIALEAIPDDAAVDALRNAAGSLDGRLLVGMINSIGIRRDAKAVDMLVAKLQDPDPEVASAAAVALGHIGNASATKSLRGALATSPAKVRSAVAEGCVLCAERLHQAGDATAATEIYDQVRQTDLPLQRVIEATRGAILARGQQGIPLLIETFRSDNKKLFQLALGTVREFPGAEIDQALAKELAQVTPARASLLIQAMADRPTTVALDAVRKAAEQGDKQVRLSAIDALKRVGDDSCLKTLLQIAVQDDPQLAQAARETLAVLPGKSVNQEIVVLLPTAKGQVYPILLQLIGQRRIDAVDDVVRALDRPEKEVRRTALKALGETVSLERLPVLISQAIAPKNAADSAVAYQALKAASVRMPDREACAEKLTLALQRAPSSSKVVLLEILSEVGGTQALKTLATAAQSKDIQLQDAGSRLLGKWNSIAAAPVLLDLAKTGPAEKYRVRALRGYIGLARKFTMPDQKRTEMCRSALNATNRNTEHQLVLEVLKLHPSASGLALAVDAAKLPNLKSEANAAALTIAQKVAGKGQDISKLLSAVGLERVKLEIVKAEYGAGSTMKDVTAIVRKQAGSSPLISLGAADYNGSFGDPAPGAVKKLKIQYRMNGKTGQATFKENALIILPMPK